MASVTYESQLACSVAGLFDFLTRPGNVPLVSDPQLGIQFTSAPEILEAGAELDFQIVTFGQIIQSTHRILRFDRPRLVIEEQVTGPMKSWTHRHEYEETGNGTLKRDIIEFQRPGGLIGMLLSDQKIQDHLEDGFYFRDQRLTELIQQGIIT